jgi:hypothetical protein
MKIKYKADVKGMGITNCHYKGHKLKDPYRIVKVGTYICMTCKFHISKDNDKKIVECSYNDDIKLNDDLFKI